MKTDKFFIDNREITAKDLKELWNEAVRATLLEVEKYDGAVPDKQVMKYMVDSVWDKISYKIKNK